MDAWIGFVCAIVIIAYILHEFGGIEKRISTKEAERRKQAIAQQEKIQEIEKRLPLPTVIQMQEFVRNIVDIYYHSPRQQELYDRICKFEAGEKSLTVDAEDFRRFQAVWIYYQSCYDPNTSGGTDLQRQFFGERNLNAMSYFRPSLPRSSHPLYARNYVALQAKLKGIPTQIKDEWCSVPKFARKAFDMLEENVEFKEETIYPIMLSACNRFSTDWSSFWMREDLNTVWSALYPKAIYILSRTSMSSREKAEWLRVEPFQLACLRAVRQKHFLKDEELYMTLLGMYIDLVSREFVGSRSRYNFPTLWHGLNAVGKAVGKNASFLNYPKYIIE